MSEPFYDPSEREPDAAEMREFFEGHTPGPWVPVLGLITSNGYEHEAFMVATAHPEHEEDEAICSISPVELITGRDKANARLIAAAPDMLAALECLLEHEDMEESCYSPGYWQILQSARNAIAKAKGEA